LETLQTSDFERLRGVAALATPDHLRVGTQNAGDTFRVTTQSGNTYLLEVVDPAAKTAHLVRCEARTGSTKPGYRGIREVDEEIRKGTFFIHKGAGQDISNTSRVIRIEQIQA